MVLSNVVFNYILIFGKLGFPALGIAGAAIGSSLSELVSVIFFIVYMHCRIDIRKYGLNRIGAFSSRLLKRILNVSLWTMIQNFVSMSTWFLFFLAVEHLGERPLAITNIIRNVSAIPFMIVLTFASTCSTLVSNLIGGGDSRYVWGTIKQTIRMAYFFTLPFIVIFVCFPSVILMIIYRFSELINASGSGFVGTLFFVYFYGSRWCAFPGCFGYRKYPCGFVARIGYFDDLCHLCGLYDFLS